jgi:lipopolysaccharide heptosyltransferase II
MRLHPLDPILATLMRRRAAAGKRPSPVHAFAPDRVTRILVVSTTGLGDTLFATPAWRALRQRYPAARIVGHVRDKFVPLFNDNPHLDAIIPYAGGYRRFFATLRALRGERFDLALIFHGMGPQAIPMAVLSEAPLVIRIPNSGEYGYLLSNAEPTPENLPYPGEHAIQCRLRIAGMADAKSDDVRMILPVTPGDREAAQALLVRAGVDSHTPTLGLVPGAATLFKQWPAERFVAAARDLLDGRSGWRLVVLGSMEERGLAAAVARALGPVAVTLAGRADLRALRGLIAGLRLLVTNDTGPLHIAVALGTPTVSLFGATDSRGTGPLQDLDRHVVLQRPAPVWDTPNIQRRSNAAMCRIGVEDVVVAGRDLLARVGS